VLLSTSAELEQHPRRFEEIDRHFLFVRNALDKVPRDSVYGVVERLRCARDTGTNVFVFGNGGSAATALHLANDLASIRLPNHAALRAHCINANVSLLTAIANDFGYEHVFSRQLATLCQQDVVIGISASGNSPNCVQAFRWAQERQATSIGILGCNGGLMLALSDLCVHVPVDDVFVTEDVHMVLAHTITRILRNG
jgi:D-sedoheptulose 7-phosphate isomerase